MVSSTKGNDPAPGKGSISEPGNLYSETQTEDEQYVCPPRHSQNIPHFNQYPEIYSEKTDGVECAVETLDDSTDYNALKFQYNSAQLSVPVGAAKPKYYDQEDRMYAYPRNHDGFQGGKTNLLNLDERKVLDNTVYSVPFVCADDIQTIAGNTNERS